MTEEKNPHYVTPEEAKKKVCPSSMGGMIKDSTNIMLSDHGCLGPECMAWRWRPMGHQDLMRGYVLPLPLVPETPQTHGYCGIVRS